jgi:hypothetical protein
LCLPHIGVVFHREGTGVRNIAARLLIGPKILKNSQKKLKMQIRTVQWLSAWLAIGFSLASFPEAKAQGKVYYTVDMGVTVSFFDQKTAPYSDPSAVQAFDKASRASLELGGNINCPLSDAFTLSSGLRYAEKGGGYKTKNPDFIYVNSISGNKTDDAYNYLKYRLVYLEVPVLAKVNLFEVFNAGSETSFLNLYGGVAGMLNIGSKLRYNVFSSSEKESWKADRLEGAEDFLLSSVAGIEWGDGPLYFYARYAASISDVYDTTQPGYENFDVNMYTISFGLGVLLR